MAGNSPSMRSSMPYLDVLRLVRDSFDTPIAAYQVSGEYAMWMRPEG